VGEREGGLCKAGRRCGSSWSRVGQLLTDLLPHVFLPLVLWQFYLGRGTCGSESGGRKGAFEKLQEAPECLAIGRAAFMTSLSIVLFSFSSVFPFGISVKKLEEMPEEGRASCYSGCLLSFFWCFAVAASGGSCSCE
jgi:hypothetical protein